MTDIIQFRPSKAFAHLDPSQSLGEGIQGGFSSINYRGKVWSLRYRGETYPFVRPDDGTPLSYLDVIIVGIGGISKVYYPPGEFDENSAGAPICASVRGDVPDPGVPEPQSRSCAVCPHNEWKQLPNGRRGKECQDHKRMAVLLMPAMTAKVLGAPLTEPVFIKIPPGSLATLKTYGNSLVHQGIPFASVITRISFSADRLFQMQFKAQQALSDAEAPLVLPMMNDPQTKRITGQSPDIREVPAPPPVKEIEQQPVETGIMAAFGQPQEQPQPKPQSNEPVRRGPGRPRKIQTVYPEKRAEPVQPTPVEPIQTNGPVQPLEAEPAAETKPVAWEESDNDLDKTVADLLSKKMNDMLK